MKSYLEQKLEDPEWKELFETEDKKLGKEQELFPWYGTIYRRYEVTCFDCGGAEMLDSTTAIAAKKEVRTQHDWSLGRDKKWRCPDCHDKYAMGACGRP